MSGEGVRLEGWPKSPDCRDGNDGKCDGSAWDLEADQEVHCRCDCHTGRWPKPVIMDTMAGGGRFRVGPILEGAPVTVDDRTVGYVQDGAVVITDPDAIRQLNAGQSLGVSIGPVDPGDYL